MELKETDCIGALKAGETFLKEKGIQNPRLEAEVLLASVLKWERVDLYVNKETVLSPKELSHYRSLIIKRSEGVPTSYLTGVREFLSMDFIVTPGVLIPRPETEVLVEEALKLLNQQFPPEKRERETINVIDLGTGSGIIGISIAKHLSGCHVYGVDISEKAVEVARENAKRMGVLGSVTLLKGDLFSPLKIFSLEGNTHAVVSNPPYIPTGELESLQREIKDHEPVTALDGGSDGMVYFKKIISKAPGYLVSGGILALEIGYNQGKKVKALMEDSNSFKNISIIKDYSGYDRVITGIKHVYSPDLSVKD